MTRDTQDRNCTRSRGSGRDILFRLIFVAVLCLAGGAPIQADPGREVPLEYQLKAAFLYKFIKFVEWPRDVLSEGDRSITVGVLGGGAMGDAVARFEGKEIVGRRLDVRKFDKVEDLEFCHVLFVPRDEEKQVEAILEASAGMPTLVVGEVEGFAESGGMVNFIIVDNKVGFEINPNAALGENLKISSKLLRLARIVKEGE
jgi:hypothetical protein